MCRDDIGSRPHEFPTSGQTDVNYGLSSVFFNRPDVINYVYGSCTSQTDKAVI